MSDSDLVSRIRTAQFTPVRMREAYDMGDVDAFLDRLVVAVENDEPLGMLVAGARFSPVRMREGYVMREVDDFLDEVVRLQADQTRGQAREPAPPDTPAPAPAPYAAPPAAPVSSSSAGVPNVVQEQRGLLSRIFGRR